MYPYYIFDDDISHVLIMRTTLSLGATVREDVSLHIYLMLCTA